MVTLGRTLPNVLHEVAAGLRFKADTRCCAACVEFAGISRSSSCVVWHLGATGVSIAD